MNKLIHWIDGANDGVHAIAEGDATTTGYDDITCADCLIELISYHAHCRGCNSATKMAAQLNNNR